MSPFRELHTRFERCCAELQSAYHAAEQSLAAGRRAAYRAVVCWIEMISHHHPELLDVCKAAAKNPRTAIDDFFAAHFAPMLSRNEDPREIETAIRAGVTEKQWVLRGGHALKKRDRKRIDRVRPVIPALPDVSLAPSEQIKVLRTIVHVHESLRRQAQDDLRVTRAEAREAKRQLGTLKRELSELRREVSSLRRPPRLAAATG